MRPIVFMLPGLSGKRPVGGFKMVYLYANMLAERGYDVTVVHSVCTDLRHCSNRSRIAPFFRYPQNLLTHSYKKIKWFDLNPLVKSKMVWCFSLMHTDPDTIYVATAVATAYALNSKKILPSHKFYFIQAFENWFYKDAEVYKSFGFDMQRVVISKWLLERIRKVGKDAELIPNGFDFKEFSMNLLPEKRRPRSVAMLYHEISQKGCRYGIEVLILLKSRFPDLRAVLFGAPARPQMLPQWIEYEQTPSHELHNIIYKESAIFLGTSLVEGWGLTVGEAMMCGCAIVCTDVDGYKEMVEKGKNALLSAPKDVEAMYGNVVRLMENDALRVKMAYDGYNRIKRFSLDQSLEKWVQLFEKC